MITSKRTKAMRTPFKFVASEYSDHVINLNKLEDRNLDVRLTQINKEMTISLNLIKRDFNHTKRKVEENTDAMELARRRNKQMYDANLRKLLNKVNNGLSEETDVYNAAKYRAFFEWASSPESCTKRISRSISRSGQLAARLSLSASAETRRSSRKSISKLPVSLRQILNKQDTLMRTNSTTTPAPEDVVAAANANTNTQKRGSIKKEVTIEIDSSLSFDSELNEKKLVSKEVDVVTKKPPKPVRPTTAGNVRRKDLTETATKSVSTTSPPTDSNESYNAIVKTVTYNKRSLCLSAPSRRSSHVNNEDL